MKKILLSIMMLAAIGTLRINAQGCGGGPSEEGVKVFGFLQSQYEFHMTDPSTNSFSFERARIGVMGKIPYDFSYYVVAELSPFIAPNPYLLDAFVTYDRFKWARVSLGSFKTPFGLETNTACNGLMTVYRSTATLQMVAPFRDLGMVFMGGDTGSLVTYQIGFMNGSGLGNFDNNTEKDLVGRVVFRPFHFLRIGGSFRYGFPSYNNTDSRTTFGSELQFNYMGITYQNEFIYDRGNYNRELGGGCSGNLIELGEERYGGWTLLAYRTKWNVEPVFKIEIFDSGNLVKYKENNMTFGLNYYFNDWTRLQVNYVYRAEEMVEIDNDEFVVQVQVKF